MPKVSIGLITFNRPHMLKKAVRSILNQSYTNFELLIGNDYPYKKITFNSLGIKKDSRIIIFNYKKNIGERNNMNFLLSKAKAKYFSWLADDDLMNKKFIELLLKPIINESKNIVASYSNYHILKKPNFNKTNLNVSSKFKIYNNKYFLDLYTSRKIKLIGIYGIIQTKYLKKVGGINKFGKSLQKNKIDLNMYPYSDTIIPIKLSRYGKISYTDNKLVIFNSHQNSMSAISKDFISYQLGGIFLLKEIKKFSKFFNNKELFNKISFNMSLWICENQKNVLKRNKSLFFLIKLKIFFIFINKISKNLSTHKYKFIYFNIVHNLFRI